MNDLDDHIIISKIIRPPATAVAQPWSWHTNPERKRSPVFPAEPIPQGFCVLRLKASHS